MPETAFVIPLLLAWSAVDAPAARVPAAEAKRLLVAKSERLFAQKGRRAFDAVLGYLAQIHTSELTCNRLRRLPMCWRSGTRVPASHRVTVEGDTSSRRASSR